jgi:hypothetical protein
LYQAVHELLLLHVFYAFRAFETPLIRQLVLHLLFWWLLLHHHLFLD